MSDIKTTVFTYTMATPALLRVPGVQRTTTADGLMSANSCSGTQRSKVWCESSIKNSHTTEEINIVSLLGKT